MTRQSIIERLGLATGLVLVAASGVLVVTAAGGSTTTPAHTPASHACKASRPAVAAHCRRDDRIDHHARSMRHRLVATAGSRNGAAHHMRSDHATEHHANHDRAEDRSSTSTPARHDDGHHGRHCDRDHHHRGDRHHDGRHHDD